VTPDNDHEQQGTAPEPRYSLDDLLAKCDPTAPVDLKARGGRRLEAVPEAFMDEVLATLAPLFE
jgi:hypothetical protein